MARISATRRRELLVQAALRVLARDGLAAMTTRAIVSEAGMSLASFHYAFTSRDELLHELVGHVVAREADVTFLALLENSHDVGGAVRTALGAYLELVTSDPGREQGMFELTQYALRTPSLDALAKKQYERYHELARELLRIVARRFRVRWDVPDDDLARLIVTLTDGVTLAWLADRDLAAAERSLDLAADAILVHAHDSVSA